MIGDEIGQIKTFLDIGANLWARPPNFGQIDGLIPKNGNFDAKRLCFWTCLNPLGGLMADAQSGLCAFSLPPPFFFFFLPSLSFIFLLAHILARPLILTFARACPFPPAPPPPPQSTIPRALTLLLALSLTSEFARAPRRLFFITFSRSFFAPGPACAPAGAARASPQMPGARNFRLPWRAARRGGPGWPRNPAGPSWAGIARAV